MDNQELSAVLLAMGHVNGLEVIEKFLSGEWDRTLSIFSNLSLLLAGLKQLKHDSSSCGKVSKVSEELYRLLCNRDDVRNDVRIVTIACEALVACTLLSNAVSQMIIDWIKSGIHAGHVVAKSSDCETLGVATSLRLLSTALEYQENCNSVSRENCIIDDIQCVELFQYILAYIVDEQLQQTDRLKALHVLPLFVSGKPCLMVSFIQMIWKLIETNQVDSGYYLVCLLTDMLLQAKPSSVARNILQSNQFWAMIHRGLASGQSLDRKQSLYVLKRIIVAHEADSEQLEGSIHCDVFWWDEKDKNLLQAVWHEFLLVYETLQQKQVCHVLPGCVVLVTCVVVWLLCIGSYRETCSTKSS